MFVERTNSNIRTSCFAFQQIGNEREKISCECTALKALYCMQNPNCRFYKPQAVFEAEKYKCQLRAKDLGKRNDNNEYVDKFGKISKL